MTNVATPAASRGRERPILFSGPMVRALLDGRKTQTRRIVKTRWLPLVEECVRVNGRWVWYTVDYDLTTPYGEPGDRLWVRETCWLRPHRTREQMRNGADTWPPVIYEAHGPDADELRSWGWKKSPSIHMPRWASRLTLEVTGVRVERVQEISEADARAEGFDDTPELGPRQHFIGTWIALNGVESWQANPWVWVIEFRRVE